MLMFVSGLEVSPAIGRYLSMLHGDQTTHLQHQPGTPRLFASIQIVSMRSMIVTHVWEDRATD